MVYKRSLPVCSGILRPLSASRYLVMTTGGYWPAVQRLPNSHIGVVTRDGDVHMGQRGRLVFVTSPDGGESWSHASVISDVGPDDRNPAFGVAHDGTLLVCFIRADLYRDGVWDPTIGRDRITPLLMARSRDSGVTWSDAVTVRGIGQEQWSGSNTAASPKANRYYSPFNKMVALPDHTILLGYNITLLESPRLAGAFVLRSRDNGITWGETATIAEGFDEPALCHLGDGRVLAMLRNASEPWNICQSESTDAGLTWSDPLPVTGRSEHPGDLIRLRDGRLLLTYGRREPPFGVRGMISRDEGNTWDHENVLLLAADGSTGDCGYPSSVQRDDGTIVTVYYSWSDTSDNDKPSGWRFGVHAAAILYRADDIP